MHKRFLLIAVFGLALILSGCGGVPTAAPPTATLAPTQIPPTATPTPSPEPTATPTLQPTATPEPTATPTATQMPETAEATAEPEGGEGTPAPEQTDTPIPTPQTADFERVELIYVSDFSSGWPTFEDAGARLYVANGQYVFDLGPGSLRYVATTRLEQRDMYAQIEVTPDQCPEGGGYGLFVRYKDQDNYYALTVFCDNRVTVYVRDDGVLNTTPLLSTTLPGGLSAGGPTTHTLGVLTRGDDVTVIFDGQTVGSFTSEARKRGDIALYAASPSSARMLVAFDNLEVWSIR